MNGNSRPLVVLFGRSQGRDQVVFVSRSGDISFQLKRNRQDLLAILSLCDGRRSVNEIRKKIRDLPEDIFHGLLEVAKEFGIIVESTELYKRFHLDSANPPEFASAMSPAEAQLLADNRLVVPADPESIALTSNRSQVLELCNVRKSTRAFTGQPLTLDELSGLLQTMYQLNTHKSTPSAGALYPISVYVAVLTSTEGLTRGLYRYDPSRLRLNPIPTAEFTPDTITRVMNSHQADRAAAVIFITADLGRMASKYANRGYRLVNIEAGHLGQNAHLYCAENSGLGMVEYGGFQDGPTARLLSLDYPREATLLAIVVGREDPNPQPSAYHFVQSWQLTHDLVGPDKPIEYIAVGHPHLRNYSIPRVEVVAKYRQLPETQGLIRNEECFGTGLATTSDEAIIKAVAEAYERYASGLLRVDASAPARQLQVPWLDPRVLAPLRPFARKRHGWSAFNPNKTWQWVEGVRHNTGEKVLVPVDLAFYPLSHKQLGRSPYISGTSNGVAAHTDLDIAKLRAMLELVERDALAVTWYGKRQVKAVPQELLSEDIRLRQAYWLKRGWSTKFLDLTLDSVPVMLALIFSPNHYPAFSAGACAAFDRAQAEAKAWDEAELFLLNWSRRKRLAPMQPQEVFSALEHGLYYFQSENLPLVQWLLDAKEGPCVSPIITNPDNLFTQFDPVFVELNPHDVHTNLKVMRAISEKLLPLNFGFGNEHVDHLRLAKLNLKHRQPYAKFPHFFA